MTLLNVEGYNSLKKDPTSGGVVNVDKTSYDNYMKSKAIALRQVQSHVDTQQAVVDLQSKINSIESDISDIRDLIFQLVQKGN